MQFPSAADVCNSATPDKEPMFEDRTFLAECEQCTATTRLSDCKHEQTETVLNYRCPKCGDILATVRAFDPDLGPIPDSGYRIDDWVFAPVVDIVCEVFPVRFPAKRNATTIGIRSKKSGGV